MENRTTIQVSEDVRKELKIIASKRDVSYEVLLKDMIEVFKELDRDKTIISIPTPLAEKMKNIPGFKSVSEYSTYILRNVMAENTNEKIEDKDAKRVRKKLEALGYLG